MLFDLLVLGLKNKAKQIRKQREFTATRWSCSQLPHQACLLQWGLRNRNGNRNRNRFVNIGPQYEYDESCE